MSFEQGSRYERQNTNDQQEGTSHLNFANVVADNGGSLANGAKGSQSAEAYLPNLSIVGMSGEGDCGGGHMSSQSGNMESSSRWGSQSGSEQSLSNPFQTIMTDLNHIEQDLQKIMQGMQQFATEFSNQGNIGDTNPSDATKAPISDVTPNSSSPDTPTTPLESGTPGSGASSQHPEVTTVATPPPGDPTPPSTPTDATSSPRAVDGQNTATIASPPQDTTTAQTDTMTTPPTSQDATTTTPSTPPDATTASNDNGAQTGATAANTDTNSGIAVPSPAAAGDGAGNFPDPSTNPDVNTELAALSRVDPQLVRMIQTMGQNGMSQTGLQTVENGLYSKWWGHDYLAGGIYTSPHYDTSQDITGGLAYEFSVNGPEGTLSDSDMNIFNSAVSADISQNGNQAIDGSVTGNG